MQKIILVLVLVSAVSRPLSAQTVDALRRGVRIEVVPIHGKSQTGTFLSLKNDSLFYKSDESEGAIDVNTGATLLTLADVQSIRVSRGRSSGGSASRVVGSAAGTVVGAIVGLALGMRANSPMTGWAVGSVLGTGIGFLGGSMYGARRGTEQWESVVVPKH